MSAAARAHVAGLLLAVAPTIAVGEGSDALPADRAATWATATGGLVDDAAVAMPSLPAATPASGAALVQADDAWWTGSLLSASAETMPVGHWLVEPYVIDRTVGSAYDAEGHPHSVPSRAQTSTAAYVMYGLADGISVGALPHVLLHAEDPSGATSGAAAGDVTAMLQLRLTPREAGSWRPVTSLVIGESFPTGRHDRLTGGPGAASGSGVHRTDVSLYAQSLLRTPSDRWLRARLNVTYSWSDSAAVTDVSAYGTPAGFRGRAWPGTAAAADAAFELSLSLRWVLALDVLYQHADSTIVDGAVVPPGSGSGAGQPLRLSSGASESWALAPAIECNFNAKVGLIAGLKFTVAGRNAAVEQIPAVALNMYFSGPAAPGREADYEVVERHGHCLAAARRRWHRGAVRRSPARPSRNRPLRIRCAGAAIGAAGAALKPRLPEHRRLIAGWSF